LPKGRRPVGLALHDTIRFEIARLDMEYDWDKIEEAGLALLFLTTHEEKIGNGKLTAKWAWKGMDWELMNRLHEKGWISDPKGKQKSVVLTEEGARRCEELFRKMFARSI
jgi:hypothetical protein